MDQVMKWRWDTDIVCSKLRITITHTHALSVHWTRFVFQTCVMWTLKRWRKRLDPDHWRVRRVPFNPFDGGERPWGPYFFHVSFLSSPLQWWIISMEQGTYGTTFVPTRYLGQRTRGETSLRSLVPHKFKIKPSGRIRENTWLSMNFTSKSDIVNQIACHFQYIQVVHPSEVSKICLLMEKGRKIGGKCGHVKEQWIK